MVIEPVLTSLRQRLQTISGGTKKNFLGKFATIHNSWHMAEMMNGQGTFVGSPIGFLSFHHEVLHVYMDKFDNSLNDDTMAHPSPAYRKFLDTITDVNQFSLSIEDWHNSVHRNTKKYGKAFSDARKNIYMKRFWQFHKFIDEKFEAWIHTNSTSYEDLDHTAI